MYLAQGVGNPAFVQTRLVEFRVDGPHCAMHNNIDYASSNFYMKLKEMSSFVRFVLNVPKIKS